MQKEKLVKVGFVAHPHGIKGEAELRLLDANSPESMALDDGLKLWLFPTTAKSKLKASGEEWEISKIRFGNKVICLFEGMRDRTHLETLIPFEVFLGPNSIPESDDDEEDLMALIDMPVVNEEGEVIGKLESISDNGMQYLFDVRLNSGEAVTLPYVETFFPDIDFENKKITMIMPEYTE
jgi:16S rRNA processing protein RimM